MRLTLPERPIRRADVLVASTVVVWVVGWEVVWVAQWKTGHASPALPLAAILLGGAISLAIEAPFLYGLARGRRWGFVSMVVMSVLILMEEVPTLLFGFRRPVFLPEALIAVFSVVALVYCGVRLIVSAKAVGATCAPPQSNG